MATSTCLFRAHKHKQVGTMQGPVCDVTFWWQKGSLFSWANQVMLAPIPDLPWHCGVAHGSRKPRDAQSFL